MVGGTVLVVEHETPVRTYLEQQLADDGFEVLSTDRAKAALELVEQARSVEPHGRNDAGADLPNVARSWRSRRATSAGVRRLGVATSDIRKRCGRIRANAAARVA